MTNRDGVAVHVAIRLATLAVFATDLAAFAASTRSANPANRLECRAGAENTPDTTSKSGKNGNVDRSSGHCRFGRKGHTPPRVLPAGRCWKREKRHPGGRPGVVRLSARA